ncbi:MAG: hypothetical protein AAGI52_11445 [Bacteroidota bacterium]
MTQHVRLLGFFFLAYGALTLLSAFLISAIFGGFTAVAGDPDAAEVFAAVSGVLWMVLLAFGLPYVIAGWGLLKGRSWSRVLSIVLGALALLSVPIGTALGIYAIWTLTRPEIEYEFD